MHNFCNSKFTLLILFTVLSWSHKWGSIEVQTIWGCTAQAFPGATIGRITKVLSRGKINISNIDIIIIHVGTNNSSSAQNVDTIISYYGANVYIYNWNN
jgi:hypothetical protein